MTVSILKPGLLVSVKTSVRGGVSYSRTDLALTVEELLAAGIAVPATAQADVSRWETTKVVADPEEHKAATLLRSKALNTIRRECSSTSFGLLCSTDREARLDEAIATARGAVRSFNSSATQVTVNVAVLKGRIAETDEEATRAIADEVAELLGAMESGVRTLDAKAIRAAAAKAKAVGSMLEARESARVDSAIEAARIAARAIVKRIDKGGEAAATVALDLQSGPIQKARFEFLEAASDEEALPSDALPSVNVQRFGDLDTDAAPASYRDRIEWFSRGKLDPNELDSEEPAALDAAPAALAAAPKSPRNLDLE